MLTEVTTGNCNWLCTGHEVFAEMLAAIDAARESVCLETYIYVESPLGNRFLDALVRARERGVRVEVMIDAWGSMGLRTTFWKPLRAAGGSVRLFNPSWLNRLGVRNHRKLLVCDERVAFVGGFNISPECEGDGVTSGWCDLGMKVEGPMAARLAETFRDVFERADAPHKRFLRLRKCLARKAVQPPNEQILLSGPGRGRSPIKRALRTDLSRAQNVQIIMGYFLPTWRLRRELIAVARRGGKVQLLLAGKSDVLLSRLSAQSLYRRFLNAGVEIHEYQPQILHAKLIIIDDLVYVGSANLDQRSLNLNHELLIRLQNQDVAAQAREVFAKNLAHSRRITLDAWRRARTLWARFQQHWAYFLLVRIDPYIARRRWGKLAA